MTFSQHLQFDVGDGSGVKFRHDICCGNCPLKETFPKLSCISSVKDSSISDIIRLSNRVPHWLFASLDQSKIGSWNHWFHLWILSFLRLLGVRE